MKLFRRMLFASSLTIFCCSMSQESPSLEQKIEGGTLAADQLPASLDEIMELAVPALKKELINKIDAVSLQTYGSVNLYTGTIPFKGQTVTVVLREDDGNYSYGIQLPKNWKFSQLIPALQQFDSVNFGTAALIFSDYEYTISAQEAQVMPAFKEGVSIKKGCNFIGDMTLSGPLAFIGDLSKINRVIVSGVIPKQTKEASFSAVIPGEIAFSTNVRAKDLSCSIALSPETGQPIYTLEHDLSIALPIKDTPLVFSSKLIKKGTNINLEGILKTDWQDPFGIPVMFKAVSVTGTLDTKKRTFTNVKMSGDVYASPKAGEFTLDIKGDITTDRYSIIITLPGTVNLAQKLPGLKVLGGLTLADTQLIYSTYEHEDTDLNILVKKGLNFSSAVQLTGSLAMIKQFTKAEKITLSGVVPKQAAGASFKALIPGQMSFGPLLHAKNLVINLTFSEQTAQPTYLLEHDLLLTVPVRKEPLVFSSKFIFKENKVMLDGTLKADWQDPLGIPGITFKAVKMRGDYNAKTRSFSNLKLSGDVYASPKAGPFSIDIKGDITTDTYAFVISLPRTVNLTQKLPGLKVLGGLTVADVQLVYSTYTYEDTQLGMRIKPGLNVKGALPLVGSLAFVKDLTKADKVELAGVIPKKATDASFSASLPGQITFGSYAQAKNLSLALYYAPKTGEPIKSLQHELHFSVPARTTPLIFTSDLLLKKDKAVLKGILKEAWKEPFGIPGVTFEDVQLTADFIYAKRKLTNIVLTGDAHGSPGGVFGVTIQGDLDSDKHSYIISLPEALKIAQKIPGLSVLDTLKIKEPKIVYSTWAYQDDELKMAVKKGLNFSGKVQLVGPLKPIGTITKAKEVIIAGAVSKTAGSSFSADLPGRLNFGDIAEAKNLKLVLSTDANGKKSMSVAHDLLITLAVAGQEIVFDCAATLQLEDKQGTITGKLKRDWKDPFILKGVTFKNLTIKATYDYQQRTLKDIDFDGEIVHGSSVTAANMEIKGDPPEKYSVIMHLPETLSLATVLPELTVLRDFSLRKPLLVYSSWEHTDKELNAEIKPDFNIVATLPFTGPLQIVQDLTKIKEVELAGVIPKKASDASFRARVPGEITFGSAFKAKDLVFLLSFSPQTGKPLYALEHDLEMKLPIRDKPLVFESKLTFAGDGATLEGTLKDSWNEPLGIPGIEVKNPRITAKLDLKKKEITNIVIEEK